MILDQVLVIFTEKPLKRRDFASGRTKYGPNKLEKMKENTLWQDQHIVFHARLEVPLYVYTHVLIFVGAH